MKRILTFVLVAFMMFALSACVNGKCDRCGEDAGLKSGTKEACAECVREDFNEYNKTAEYPMTEVWFFFKNKWKP